jgi:hypothetical protein
MENQTAQNPNPEPTLTPVQVSGPKTKFPVVYLVLSLFVLVLLASTVFLYYQNIQLKNMLLSYQAQPAISPTPTVYQSPVPTTDPTADWKTYTNADYGYMVKYPQNLETEEAKYHTLFNIIRTQPGGPELPAYYVSVVPDGFWQNGAIYNDPLADFIPGLLALKIAGVYDNGEWNTFTRLQDSTVGALQAMIYENAHVWEYAGKDRRILIKKNGRTYMIGKYYNTDTELSNFQTFLSTFKFTN